MGYSSILPKKDHSPIISCACETLDVWGWALQIWIAMVAFMSMVPGVGTNTESERCLFLIGNLPHHCHALQIVNNRLLRELSTQCCKYFNARVRNHPINVTISNFTTRAVKDAAHWVMLPRVPTPLHTRVEAFSTLGDRLGRWFYSVFLK